MQTPINKNLICSVLCVDIVEHSRKLEFDQFHRKARLQKILQAALKDIPEDGRFILDTGDGAAIAFFGAPEDALTVALFIADGITQDEEAYPQDPIELRSGIHLGPVRIMNDINGIAQFLGDGLNATQRIMSLARPGNTVVSRQYYDVVAPENADAFRVLTPIGKRHDREGREYELYIVGKLDAARGIQWGAMRRHIALRLRAAGRKPAMRWGAAGAVIASAMALWLPHMYDVSVPETGQPVPAAALSHMQEAPVAPAVTLEKPVAGPVVEAHPKSRKTHTQHAHSRDAHPSGTVAATVEPSDSAVGKSAVKTVCSAAERMLSKCS